MRSIKTALFASIIGGLVATAIDTGAQTSRPDDQPTSQPDRSPEQVGKPDAHAVKVAERVMATLGGRDAWDDARFLTWRFFGSRLHVWDKRTGNIRVEWERQGTKFVVLMNLNTREGSVFRDGQQVEDETELAGALQGAYSMWINDSYWLIMPYKLLDPGVTITHVGERQTLENHDAEVLQLTFDDGIGLTSQNKYEVYVGKESGLVEQWDFFRDAAQDSADFQTLWTNWRRFGKIMLSDDRGEMRGRPIRHTDVAVFDELPETVFTSPDPVNLRELGGHWGDDEAEAPG